MKKFKSTIEMKTAEGINYPSSSYIINQTLENELGQQRRFTYGMSKHARKRITERAIKLEHAILIIEFGTYVNKQGLTFYSLRKKDIPASFKHQLQKLNNLVLIYNERENEIVTVYHSKNGSKHLKRKYKVNLKVKNCAA